MARRVRDKDLASRATRVKLKARGKPYYKSIGDGLHVGYRKGERVGKWVVRRYIGDQKYAVETIATADDVEDADGNRVLDFWQAQERARHIRNKMSYSGPYRVRDAIEDYRKPGVGYDVGLRIERHILPSLGDELVSDLTAERLEGWFHDLARSRPFIPGTGRQRKIDLNDPEVVRGRKSSANRCRAILFAALNRAFKRGKVTSDTAWRRVEPFKKVDRARTRYLSIAESERLLNACDEEFRLLVRGALETGASYGDLCRMRCDDFKPDTGLISIRVGKTSHEHHIILSDDGVEFFSGLVAGRAAASPMFGKEWKPSHQARRMKEACKRANIEPHVGFHQLRHTWASHAVMGGMPLMVVSKNMGHTSTRMVEKHYGHLAPSYLVDQVRKHAPRFGAVPRSNVRAL